MIGVRSCIDRNALAAFLLPSCLDEMKHKPHVRSLTPEILASALESWDIVEFFDSQKGSIIGAVAREPDQHLHIYVDSTWRKFWAPHTSLDAVLDIFLTDCDRLFADIPLANKTTIRMVRKLGFIQTGTENGNALHVVTRQTRKRRSLDFKSGRIPPAAESI